MLYKRTRRCRKMIKIKVSYVVRKCVCQFFRNTLLILHELFFWIGNILQLRPWSWSKCHPIYVMAYWKQPTLSWTILTKFWELLIDGTSRTSARPRRHKGKKNLCKWDFFHTLQKLKQRFFRNLSWDSFRIPSRFFLEIFRKLQKKFFKNLFANICKDSTTNFHRNFIMSSLEKSFQHLYRNIL